MGNRLLAPWLSEGRNHFDRSTYYWFYSFPMAEWLLRRRLWSDLSGLFSFFIMSIAAGYGLIEWQYAVIAGGEEELPFLGSRGDQ